MRVVLNERMRGPGQDRFAWAPFDDSDEFDRHWWAPDPTSGDGYRWVRALADGREVARVELDEHPDLAHYSTMPTPPAPEIQLLEVSAAHRRRGIGTAVVRELAAAHPTGSSSR